MAARILIVENDVPTAEAYGATLEGAGYITQSAATGKDALRVFRAFAPDLVLLDLHLDGELTGFDVLAAIRKQNQVVRVVIVTGIQSEDHQAFGLTGGADDYVIKNVSPKILLARVQAQLRRAPVAAAPPFVRGRIKVDFARNLLWNGPRCWPMSDTERKILARLAETPDRAVSFHELSEVGWSIKLPKTPMDEDLAPLDGCIYRLREKAGAEFIVSAGGGYMIAPEGAAAALGQAASNSRRRAAA